MLFRSLTQRVCLEGLKGNLKKNGKSYGLILNIGGYYKNVFSLSPSFEITTEEMDLAVELFDELMQRCLT